jgi:hypothetical protein
MRAEIGATWSLSMATPRLLEHRPASTLVLPVLSRGSRPTCLIVTDAPRRRCAGRARELAKLTLELGKLRVGAPAPAVDPSDLAVRVVQLVVAGVLRRLRRGDPRVERRHWLDDQLALGVGVGVSVSVGVGVSGGGVGVPAGA